MKRILLVTSLLVVATQTPLQALPQFDAIANVIKNPRIRAHMAMGTAFAAPLLAGLKAYWYEESLTTSEEKNLKQQYIAALNSVQDAVWAIENHYRSFPTIVRFGSDADDSYIDAEIKVRAFYNSLKDISQMSFESNEFINSFKNRIDDLLAIINEDMSRINPENKEFAAAFLNLKGATNILDHYMLGSNLTIYGDWYPVFKLHVNHVDQYLNDVHAKKVAVIDQENRRKESLNTLKGLLAQYDFENIQYLDKALKKSLITLKELVYNDGSSYEISGLAYSTERAISNQLSDLKSSNVPGWMLLTTVAVSLPLIAYAAHVVDGEIAGAL
jgi:hypothetical protein